MPFLIFGAVLLGIVVIALIWGVGIYNGLVALRNRFKNAFAQIDVQLKRRHDLIPNLVETAKGYLKHESETLEAVVKARNIAAGALSKASANPADGAAVSQLMTAEASLGGALGRLIAVAEAYPQLKADASMGRVMEELTSTENKVAFSRQAYNDAVTAYNTGREQFPAVLVAGALGFQPAQLFEILDSSEKEAPKVKFT